MKHIKKQHTPQLLAQWKITWRAKNGLSLSELCVQESMTGKKLWAALRTSRHEESIYSKEQLREELLKEQGYICCYCNRRIDLQNNSIEHFLPKGNPSYFKFAYSYDNLFLSCDGFAKEPSPRLVSCNERRLEHELLPLSPLHEDIESHFTFTIDGQIVALTQQGETLIKKLGLDIDQLNDLRKAYIGDYIYENPFEKTFISAEVAQQRMAELNELQNGQFTPFSVAIQQVIENAIF